MHTENDTTSVIAQDQRQQVKQRASAAIEALPPAERLSVMIDLQDRLIDLTPEDQTDELARWLDRIAQR